MNTIGIILIVVGVAAVGVLLGMMVSAYSTKKLKSRFGSEYHRAVQESGSKWRAESKLRHIEKRVQHLKIRALTTEERQRFADSWRAVQARFVDNPEGALTEAD